MNANESSIFKQWVASIRAGDGYFINKKVYVQANGKWSRISSIRQHGGDQFRVVCSEREGLLRGHCITQVMGH